LGLPLLPGFLLRYQAPYLLWLTEALVYKNSPQKRAFHSLQADSVKVTIQGTGWQMLFSKMKPETSPIIVDLSPLDYKDYVVLNVRS
jgi:hypothetical protein